MSGKRNKNSSDVIMNRQEYLDNLNLQVQLNDANEQAVSQYVSTGQVPPVSQMKDNRTTTQILADVEKLKISLIKDLEPIADPQFAQQIVYRLLQSPLNVDNKLLIFTAQRVDELVKNLAKVYKYGIKGDENDAEAFVFYINKFYLDNKKLLAGSAEFMNRIGRNKGSAGGSDLIALHPNLLTASSEFLSFVKTIYRVFDSIPEHLVNITKGANLIRLVDRIKSKFSFILAILPKDIQTINKMEEILQTYEGTETYDNTSNDYELLIDTLNHHIPNIEYINTLLGELYRQVEQLKRQYRSLADIIEFEDEDFDPIINSIDILTDSLNRLDSVLSINLAEDTKRSLLKTVEELEDKISSFTYKPQEGQPSYPYGETKKSMDTGTYTVEQILDDIEEKTIADNDDAGKIKLDILRSRFEELKTRPKSDKYKVDLETIQREASKLLADMQDDRYHIPGAGHGLSSIPAPRTHIKKMSGTGLSRADYTQGIDPSPRYIKFGRYMINNKKLNDNVLSLRRSKGSAIASIPATKMTSQLGGVIKKIVGGGVPGFDELNALSDAEKRYLYRVSQEADIYDKIKIPTPSKDEEEKDIHAFNVMKGEIMAGNNSKELISKFKLLLNKLSKKNVLPKSQVREILEELLELGF